MKGKHQKLIPKGLKCRQELSLDGLVKLLSSKFAKVSDPRGKNSRYSLSDVIMSAFAMFSIKDPSLLHFERHMSQESNLRSIFNIDKVPSDTQMRKILDRLPEDAIDFAFKTVMQEVQRGKVLEGYVSLGGTYLVSIDGTGFFSSNNLFNKNCTEKQQKNGDVIYQQQLLGACLMKPGEKEVFPLCPELIIKQDGVSKNDCEMNAFKRLIPKIKSTHSKMKFTIIGDALFSNAPVVELLESNNMQFILGAKPKGNSFLFNKLDECQAYEYQEGEQKIHRFKFINNVSVNESNPDCKVNFISYEEEDLHTNKIKKFAWITSHEINNETVAEIVKAGRSRWKIENETFNTLKNQGYNLGHNYGLGENNLSVIFTKLMMLAFFVDQVQQRCCVLFQTAVSLISGKIHFWTKMRNHFSNPLALFSSMEEILQAIVYGFNAPPISFKLQHQ